MPPDPATWHHSPETLLEAQTRILPKGVGEVYKYLKFFIEKLKTSDLLVRICRKSLHPAEPIMSSPACAFPTTCKDEKAGIRSYLDAVQQATETKGGGMKRSLTKLTVALTTMAAFALMAGTSFALTQDFEAGNTGFTSAYTYHGDSGPPYGLYEEGYYTVGSSPGLYHPLWANFGAHSGSQMMIVNGDTTADLPVWAALPVAVIPGQQYIFSAWLASQYPGVGHPPISPASLAFSINGNQSVFTLSSPVGTWQQFSTLWTAGETGFANISIINGNTNYDGNDFAIDDITLNPVPEPGTMLLLGVGMLGVVAFGKRRMSKEA